MKVKWVNGLNELSRRSFTNGAGGRAGWPGIRVFTIITIITIISTEELIGMAASACAGARLSLRWGVASGRVDLLTARRGIGMAWPDTSRTGFVEFVQFVKIVNFFDFFNFCKMRIGEKSMDRKFTKAAPVAMFLPLRVRKEICTVCSALKLNLFESIR